FSGSTKRPDPPGARSFSLVNDWFARVNQNKAVGEIAFFRRVEEDRPPAAWAGITYSIRGLNLYP
ncbi:MAG: hypothetical protein ACWGQW_14690, partial [bacterium]